MTATSAPPRPRRRRSLPSLILLGAAVVPATCLTFVASRRLPTDPAASPIAVTALLGGMLGTVVAGTLEYEALRRLETLPSPPTG